MTSLDALDTAILAQLQSDARRSNRDVAAAVGVSPTTALDRTRALRDRGVITGASLDVNLAAIGRPVQAMIAVRIRPPSRHNIETFRNWVSALPDTLGVFVTSGTEDFLIHVAVPDNDSLYACDRQAHRAVRDRRRTHVDRVRAPAPAGDHAGRHRTLRHGDTRRDRPG